MEAAKKTSARVGAIWSKKAKSGTDFLGMSVDLAELLKCLNLEPPTGIDKVRLSAFQNTKKTEEKQPDYYITYFFE